MMRHPADPPTPEEITSLEPHLRRRVARLDADVADDIIQETLTRLLEVRHRLESKTLAAYAAITLRNLIASLRRERELEDRYRHRLLDPPTVEDPAVEVESRDEASLVLDVLAELDVDDRELLRSRALNEDSTGDLASRWDSSRTGVAVRLTRLRARARVEYAFALYGRPLPYDDCRPVLLSLAAADKRRQVQLGSADHLRTCPACGVLAGHVVAGRRPVFILVPGLLAAKVKRFLQNQTPTTIGAGTGVVVVLVAGLAAAMWAADTDTGASPPPSDPIDTPSRVEGPPPRDPIDAPLRVEGQPVAGDWSTRLRRRAGAAVEGRGLTVQRVVTDEGLWVSDGSQRIWVQLVGDAESPFQVRAGQRVSFDGVARRHHARFVDALGVRGPDRRELLTQGVHVDVPIQQWRIDDDVAP